MTPSRDITRLIEIMAALRHADEGCPWDIEQTFETIAPYTIEEAYEVADAIDRGDRVDLEEELGDLLLQVVYHARLAEEEGAFAFDDVVEAITTKLIRRHPHVFGDAQARSAGSAKGVWNAIKAEEKRTRADKRAAAGLPAETGGGLLDSVPVGLPPLAQALALQKKASTVGFDWNDPRAVIAKIREEVSEIEAELDIAPPDQARLEDEVGDLLFVAVNLARHLAVDPDRALRGANAKMRRRFGHIEERLASKGRSTAEASLTEMEALWQEAKNPQDAE